MRTYSINHTNTSRNGARENSRVRVIVALDIEVHPEGELSGPDVEKQRQEIARAQDKLLWDLDIPPELVVARMNTLPLITLEVLGRQSPGSQNRD